MINRSEVEGLPRPRMLIVTRNFPPLVGGMERLLHHVYSEVARDFDVTLLGPTGSSHFVPAGAQVIEVPPRPIWWFLLAALGQSFRLVLRNRPTIIVAGSGLTALPAVLIGSVAGVKVATYVHGLDLIATHPVYRTLFVPAIRHCDRVIANSNATRDLAIGARVPEEKVKVVHPGVAIDAPLSCDLTDQFLAKIGASGRPLMLSVGRLTPRKGLLEFVELSLPTVIKAVPNALLVVIGEPAHDAALCPQRDVLVEVRAAVRRLGLEGHVQFLGRVSEEELDLAYSAASVHVFPVVQVHGDAEGFGMVAVEAAAHGLPTVAFGVGGVSEAIGEGISGHLAAPGDYAGLSAATIAALDGSQPYPACREFAMRFSWALFGERFRSAIADCH
jgi:phosphatidylinositol alpha-1,6-mannosyltransferase